MDARVCVLIELLPPDALFRHPYHSPSLWAPDLHGYVDEADPWRAGLYEDDGYYQPWASPSTRVNDHSYTLVAADVLGEYSIRDGTPLALLVDALTEERKTKTALSSLAQDLKRRAAESFVAYGSGMRQAAQELSDALGGVSSTQSVPHSEQPSADVLRLTKERDDARRGLVIERSALWSYRDDGPSPTPAELAEQLWPGCGLVFDNAPASAADSR